MATEYRVIRYTGDAAGIRQFQDAAVEGEFNFYGGDNVKGEIIYKGPDAPGIIERRKSNFYEKKMVPIDVSEYALTTRFELQQAKDRMAAMTAEITALKEVIKDKGEKNIRMNAELGRLSKQAAAIQTIKSALRSFTNEEF